MTAVVATMPAPLSTGGAKKKKRLSFGWGLKNSDQPQPIALLAENDDEAEKRQRRKSLARRGSFIDEESSSEAMVNVNNNNTNRRTSMKLSETPIPLRKGKALSSAQITDLYARCIQLSAENVCIPFILYLFPLFALDFLDLILLPLKENQSSQLLGFESHRLH
jgi:hypothetical protein